MSIVVGWDIGGAHLKAARCESGRIVDVVQLASPLRLGLAAITEAFARATARMGAADLNAVTMTGELADTFVSRRDGVEQLAALAVRALAPAPVTLYAGRGGFVATDAAARHVENIASANWHASATVAASTCRDGLFVDMGSTTTDIVPLRHGKICPRGYSDIERLSVGELVYTGLVRSFLMAVAPRAPFDGRWVPLINENFANMADVHRILGTLPDDADQMNTADGREKTVAASCARLARMVGADAADADDAAWTALARWFAEAQICAVIDGAMLVLSAVPLPEDAPMVGAGIGAGVIAQVAHRLGRKYVAFASLIDAIPSARAAVSQCAPAAAVALLAGKE